MVLVTGSAGACLAAPTGRTRAACRGGRHDQRGTPDIDDGRSRQILPAGGQLLLLRALGGWAPPREGPLVAQWMPFLAGEAGALAPGRVAAAAAATVASGGGGAPPLALMAAGDRVACRWTPRAGSLARCFACAPCCL